MTATELFQDGVDFLALAARLASDRDPMYRRLGAVYRLKALMCLAAAHRRYFGEAPNGAPRDERRLCR
jgi:hypothetical protein